MKQDTRHKDIIIEYLSGRKVQYRNCPSLEWKDIDAPIFAEFVEYRLKPEKKIVHYNEEEMAKLVGEPLRLKDSRSIYICSSFQYNPNPRVLINGTFYNSDSLSKCFTRFDGSPCGKYVEE